MLLQNTNPAQLVNLKWSVHIFKIKIKIKEECLKHSLRCYLINLIIKSRVARVIDIKIFKCMQSKIKFCQFNKRIILILSLKRKRKRKVWANLRKTKELWSRLIKCRAIIIQGAFGLIMKNIWCHLKILFIMG